MRSRTSWFNLALVRKNMLRGWPLWTAFSLLWLGILPMTIFSNSHMYYNQSTLDMRRDILEIATNAGPFITLLYGVLVAMVMFSYLYKSRSVNTFGALPLRRETLFGSAVIAGILVFLIPTLLTAVMTWFASMSAGLAAPMACLEYLAFNGLIYLFAFGFAALCAALVGNTLSLLGLYTILNFTVAAIGYTVCVLLSKFLFGFTFDSRITSGAFSPYSPLVQLSFSNVATQWEMGELTTVSIETWPYVLILALVGLVCFAAAFLLFRRRHMERAGDVIAVKQLRPVFKYTFALGCAVVLGGMFCTIWSLKGFLPALLCCLLGGFLGYFLAEILLQKSFAVWKKEWLGFGCLAIAITAILTFTHLDGWGYENKIPTTDTVASVQIRDGGYQVDGGILLEDPAFITDVIAFHQAIVQERPNPDLVDRYTVFSVRYTLFDGSTFHRCYPIPFTDDSWNKDGLYSQYCSLFTDPYYLEAALLRDFKVTSPADFAWSEIKSSEDIATILTQEQAYDLYITALLPDLRDGNIGFDLAYKGQMRDKEVGYTRISLNIFADETYTGPMATKEDLPIEGDRPTTSLSLTVTPYATRTIAAIEKLGATYYPTVELQ